MLSLINISTTYYHKYVWSVRTGALPPPRVFLFPPFKPQNGHLLLNPSSIRLFLPLLLPSLPSGIYGAVFPRKSAKTSQWQSSHSQSAVTRIVLGNVIKAVGGSICFRIKHSCDPYTAISRHIKYAPAHISVGLSTLNGRESQSS